MGRYVVFFYGFLGPIFFSLAVVRLFRVCLVFLFSP